MSELENGIISIKWILIGWLIHIYIFLEPSVFDKLPYTAVNSRTGYIEIWYSITIYFKRFEIPFSVP